MSSESNTCSVSLTMDSYNSLTESTNGPCSLQNATVAEKKSRSSRKDGRELRWFNGIRIAVILVVSATLTLPFILVHLLHQKGQGDVEEECSAALCSPTPYNGTTCLLELQQWQTNYYHAQNNSQVFIPAEKEQEVQEMIAQQTLSKLQLLNPKEQCVNVFKSFMCLLLFGLCNVTGQSIEPLYEECVAIQSESCAEEVQLALSNPNTTELFPDCISFNVTKTCANNNNMEITIHQNTTCSEGFYFDNNSLICTPECGVWTMHSATADKAITVVLILGIASGITVNITIILISIAQHKRMLKFPSTFIFYQCVSLLIYSSVDIISRVNKEEIVCGSRNLLEVLEDANSTPYFCRIVGGLFVYSVLQMALWWFFHIAILFWGVLRPLQYRQWCDSGKLKCIHLTMVITGVVLPLIPTLICNWIGGFGINLLAHYTCQPRSILAFRYSLYVPLNILNIVGIAFLVIILSTIALEKYRSVNKGRRHAEVKILIIIFFFFTFILYLFTSVAVIQQRGEEFSDNLSAYFACEAQGEEECSKNKYFEITYTIFNVLPVIMFVNMTSISFIYVFNIDSCKKVFNKSLISK